MSTGDWIRQERKARGWNQTELGERLGVSQVQVSQWETGKSQPSPHQEAQLRELLGDGSGSPEAIKTAGGAVLTPKPLPFD